jgi:hypothetical protein
MRDRDAGCHGVLAALQAEEHVDGIVPVPRFSQHIAVQYYNGIAPNDERLPAAAGYRFGFLARQPLGMDGRGLAGDVTFIDGRRLDFETEIEHGEKLCAPWR